MHSYTASRLPAFLLHCRLSTRIHGLPTPASSNLIQMNAEDDSDELKRQRMAKIRARWESHRAPPPCPHYLSPLTFESTSPVNPLPSRLTVVITTSPVRSNPDTLLLRRVVHSFSLVAGLIDCPKVVVCDGFRLARQTGGSRYKKGKICPEEVGAYRAFIAAVEALAAQGEGGFRNMRVEALEERIGFAGAVHRACGEWVHTPYVMVVQHDRLFLTR